MTSSASTTTDARSVYRFVVQSSFFHVDYAELLNELLRTKSAGLKSQTLPACSENTRVDILDQLKCWSCDPNRLLDVWFGRHRKNNYRL